MRLRSHSSSGATDFRLLPVIQDAHGIERNSTLNAPYSRHLQHFCRSSIQVSAQDNKHAIARFNSNPFTHAGQPAKVVIFLLFLFFLFGGWNGAFIDTRAYN